MTISAKALPKLSPTLSPELRQRWVGLAAVRWSSIGRKAKWGIRARFNWGSILALAIGRRYCVDLSYVAHERGMEIEQIAVTVTLDREGTPMVAPKAVLPAKNARHRTALNRDP